MPSTLDDLLSFLKLAKPGQPLEALGQLDARTQCMVLVWALRQRGHADPDGRVADIQIRRESSGVLTHGKPRVHAVGIKQKNRRVLVDLNGNVGVHAIANAVCVERWGAPAQEGQYTAEVGYASKDASSDVAGCLNYLNGICHIERQNNKNTLSTLMRLMPNAIEHAALEEATPGPAPRRAPPKRL